MAGSAYIGVVALLIAALMNVGVTVEQIFGVVAGVISAAFAVIYNAITYIVNNLLSFAEFIANLFVDPVYAIQKLFYDMSRNVYDFVGSLLNGLLDGINMLITGINKVTGAKISAITWRADTSFMDDLEPNRQAIRISSISPT